MLYSKLFIPTLKEIPSNAIVPSHVLMLRAGMIRRGGSQEGSTPTFPWG